MSSKSVFSSESVSEGHPDKIADQVSDAILDSALAKDKMSRVACEVMVKNGMVMIAGEMRTNAWVDVEAVARQTIRNIGYDDPMLGFDADSCAVLNAIGRQSDDIAIGVDRTEDRFQGAGDQGLMFGYATDETDVFMPAPITYAHKLVKRQSELRKTKKLSWLRPDAKAQIAFKYMDDKIVGVQNVVLSTQHDPEISHKDLCDAVMEEIIKPVMPKEWLQSDTQYFINPTGRFVTGGPVADCGLTGRKIIVDTYGGMARHGGGCFSGKDASKVDRSAAYMARYIAKNIVAAGLAKRCEVQLSYAIGVVEPTSVMLDSFGTAKAADERIAELICKTFDLSPYGIIKSLKLLDVVYLPTASYGHFGRNEDTFTWEKLDKVDELSGAGLPRHVVSEEMLV